MAQYLKFNFQRFLVGKVRSDGAVGGVLGDDLQPGQISGMYVGKFPKSASLSTVEAAIATQTGGGRQIGQITTGDRPLAPFSLTAADIDTFLFALAGGGAIDQTNSLIHRYSSNPMNVDLPALTVAFQQGLYDPSRKTGAAKMYNTDIIPFLTLEAQKGEIAENTFVDQPWRGVPSPTTFEHTGREFDPASGMKLTDGMTDWYGLTSNKPLHIATAMADGVGAQTFTLPYLPVADVLTNNATLIEVVRNGVPEAATAIDLVTGEITLGAGADEDIFVITYATDYVPSP